LVLNTFLSVLLFFYDLVNTKVWLHVIWLVSQRQICSCGNIQNYAFTCCFVWVWNLNSHPKGRIQNEGFGDRVLREYLNPRNRHRRMEETT
jgi:hypothetical protein